MATYDYRTGLQEIGDGVFAYIREGIGWDICNSGLIVGDEECLVVDAMMVGSMVETFMVDVRKVTVKPVRYVVDTHHHADHAFGNQFYRPGANIVGHDGCRDSLIRRGADPDVLIDRWPQYEDDWRKLALTPPTVTYSDRMTVHLGGRSVDLIHPGPAHTFGDTLVYLPDEKILFTGDVAFQYLVPLAADGHVSKWIKATRRLRNHMDIETLVTGHGPVAKKDAIGWTHRYFRSLKKHCKRYFRMGKGPDDAAASFTLGELEGWEEPERNYINARRMFIEFRGGSFEERTS